LPEKEKKANKTRPMPTRSRPEIIPIDVPVRGRPCPPALLAAAIEMVTVEVAVWVKYVAVIVYVSDCISC
jgi:hypothetical protein